VVRTKLLALTDSVAVAVAPRAATLILSVPVTFPVTSTVAWPFASVVTVGALRVLPSAALTRIARFWIPTPAESRRRMVSRVVEPRIIVVTPLTLSVVPSTCTVLVLLRFPIVAVTVIVQFVESPNVVRRAVAVPFAPVVPLTT
jgi:hypothetical protein